MEFAEINGVVYFSADTLGHGSELWRTDGTSEGTRMVKELRSGAQSSKPQSLRSFNGSLYFYASGEAGSAIYRTDGTADGTERMSTAATVASWNHLTVLNDQVILFNGPSGLSAADPDFRTIQILTNNTVSESTVADGRLYFLTSRKALWVTDGTPEGTAEVQDFDLLPTGPESPFGLTYTNGTLFFLDVGRRLWKSDGTGEGTVEVSPLAPQIVPDLEAPTAFNGTVYFTTLVNNERELWQSDGTEEGTVAVNMSTFSEDFLASALNVTAPDGRWNFFEASSSVRILWRTDGNQAEAHVLLNELIYTGIAYELVDDTLLIAESNTLSEFNPATGDHSLIRSFRRLTSDWVFDELTVFGNSLLFTADDGIHGHELWISDGTPEGTQLVRDLVTATADFTIDRYERKIFAAGDTLFCVASPFSGLEILMSTAGDGSALTDLVSARQVDAVTSIDGVLYFRTVEYRHPESISNLWRFDSNADVEPVLLGQSTALPTFASPRILQSNNGTLILQNDTLRRLDETSNGGVSEVFFQFARWVSDAASIPSSVIVIASHPDTARDTLWHTDGTADGTAVIDLPDLVNRRFNSSLVMGQDEVFAIASVGGNIPNEIWRTDGTSDGTVLVVGEQTAALESIRNLSYWNDALYFVAARDYGAPATFWKHDLLTGETNTLDLGINIDMLRSGFTAVDDGLVFTLTDPIHGDEVWITDGTRDGTMLLADVFPGPGGSAPQDYVRVGDMLYFSAVHPQYGREVFSVDLAAPRLAALRRTADDTQLTNPEAVVFRATFTEAVHGVRPETFSVDGGSSALVTDVTEVPGSDGTQFDITVAGGDIARFDGQVALNLAAPADVQDTDGTELLDTEPTIDENYTVRYVFRPELSVSGDDEARPTFQWTTDPEFVSYEIWFSRTDINRERIHYDARVTASTWSPDIRLTAGRYRFWVRGTAADGTRTAWSAPQDLRVNPTLHDVPLTTNGRPVFRWDPVPNSTHELYVRTSSGDIIHNGLTGGSFTPSTPLPAGSVFWWVRAVDGFGRKSPWSIRHETRSDGATVVSAPTETVGSRPTFSWLERSNADHYVLYVSRVGESQPVLRLDDLTATSWTATSSLEAGRYRVWIKAVSSTDNVPSRWSRPAEFEVTDQV
ncbi:MAG: hypothetical protein R3C49_01715 [Planctomycetaceae bacterium]